MWVYRLRTRWETVENNEAQFEWDFWRVFVQWECPRWMWSNIWTDRCDGDNYGMIIIIIKRERNHDQRGLNAAKRYLQIAKIHDWHSPRVGEGKYEHTHHRIHAHIQPQHKNTWTRTDPWGTLKVVQATTEWGLCLKLSQLDMRRNKSGKSGSSRYKKMITDPPGWRGGQQMTIAEVLIVTRTTG